MVCSATTSPLAKGTYQKSRVFFANEEAAIAAGHRPCGRCTTAQFKVWKAGGTPGTPSYPWKILPK